MKVIVFTALLVSVLILITNTNTKSEPGFNGTAADCGGSGCHTSEAGIVSAEVLNNFQVRITVTGTTSKVGGELVDAGGNVVAVINQHPATLLL